MSSYKVFVRDRNYVADFLKAHYKRKDISMLELTPDFIKEFFASKATRGRAQYLPDDGAQPEAIDCMDGVYAIEGSNYPCPQ